MPKILANIRRQRIDRMFVGTHGLTTVEAWQEATHMIKGASFEAKRIIETDGELNEVPDGGFLITMTAELPQNTVTDYRFYDEVMNGKRCVAIVTGKGPKALVRIFRTRPIGGGKWQDNRISIVTNDNYNSSMDKAAMKLSGYVRQYERYQIDSVAIVGGKLLFDGITVDKISRGIITNNGQ